LFATSPRFAKILDYSLNSRVADLKNIFQASSIGKILMSYSYEKIDYFETQSISNFLKFLCPKFELIMLTFKAIAHRSEKLKKLFDSAFERNVIYHMSKPVD